MIPILVIASSVFFIIALVLFFRSRALEKSITRIEEDISFILDSDTNVLISPCTTNRELLSLSSALNDRLREMRTLKHQYESGDREVKDAMTNLAHDIRTPLTAISGYIELLEEKDLDEEGKRYLEVIKGRVEAMKALSEELFTFTLMNGREGVECVKVELKRTLEEVLLSHERILNSRSVGLNYHAPEEPIWVMGEEKSISRVFSNIIENASKYSDGSLTVNVGREGSVTFSNPSSSLDALETAKLFHRYYTVESGKGGNGLGLSIAKRLVEDMGGTIRGEWEDGYLTITVGFIKASS